mgnify:CR=1 FL=1
MSFFADKVIIVTGASSGIGLASARLFGREGAKVVMAARSLDRLEALAGGVAPEDRVLCVKCDVSREEECRALVEKTVERFGRIDILVNNAGISMRAMFNDLDLKVIHSLMDVNFWGTVNCTKYALPWLLKSRGSVVGVISIAGYSALPARTGYSASKYAVRGFLDTLRIEHLKDGLNVLVFAPGYTSSNVRNAALTAGGGEAHERGGGRRKAREGFAQAQVRGHTDRSRKGHGAGAQAFPETYRQTDIFLYRPRGRKSLQIAEPCKENSWPE